MKHPKSKLLIALACLVLPLLFASCSKDEESTNDPMPFVPIEQNDFTADILQPDINYSIPIRGDDPDDFFLKAVGTYEGTLTVYDPKTKQVIPSDFDNHVSAKFESYLNQFSLTPIPHPFTLYALKKDQYAYDLLYKINVVEFGFYLIASNHTVIKQGNRRLYVNRHFFRCIVESSTDIKIHFAQVITIIMGRAYI